MSEPVRLPSTRYRGRILGAGLIAAGALYSFGAPLYVGRIEDDLDHRVPDELADAGFQGISAQFDGQDGTLHCVQPLDDPEAANRAAYDVWGVRAITLDRTCRVNTASEAESALQSAAAPPGSSDTGSGGTGSGGTGSTEGSSTIGAGYATVVALMHNDPRLAYFSMLLDESGLAAHLGDEPVTVFAPTDDAFELLPADAIAGLRADPEMLAHVLGQHVALGTLASSLLRSGPLTMADGSTLDVVVDGDKITIGGATITDPDLIAGNGVVHVIDRVLIPDDVDMSQLEASS